MRIAINAQCDGQSPHEGASSWRRLYRTLALIRPVWRVDVWSDSDAATADGPAQWTWRRGGGTRGWAAWRMLMALRRSGADVLHCPHRNAPSRCPVPVVASIDSLPPRNTREQAQGRHRITRTCRDATRIIVPTAHLRTCLVDGFGAEASRTDIIAPGPVTFDCQASPEARRDALQRYGVERPFILHYGAGDDRRYARKLIEAWAMTDKAIRQAVQLVVVGVSEPHGQALAAVVNRLGLARSVRLLRWFADRNDLHGLLSAADIAAMPQAVDGFPQFVVEAWAARAALLTGDRGGVVEVAGEAAMRVDPTDPCAIARGIRRLVHDRRLRLQMIAAGSQRLSGYTWQRAAEHFAQSLERATGVASPAGAITDRAARRPAA